MSGASFSSNDLLLRSFARSLRARNRSPKTISGYLEAARLLCDHVGDRDLLELTRGDIQDFTPSSPSTTGPRRPLSASAACNSSIAGPGRRS